MAGAGVQSASLGLQQAVNEGEREKPTNDAIQPEHPTFSHSYASISCPVRVGTTVPRFDENAEIHTAFLKPANAHANGNAKRTE